MNIEDNTTQSILQSEKYFTKACKLNNAQGCLSSGLLFIDTSGLPMDLKKAGYFFTKACDGNISMACLRLGFMYEKGLGFPKNYKNSINLYNKSCKLGNLKSCYFLGNMYFQGKGIEKNYKKALNLFTNISNKGYIITSPNNNLKYAIIQPEFKSKVQFFHLKNHT